MIRSGRGSRFFLDISRATFIPKKLMDVVGLHLHRAVKMMPPQDVVDLYISGADKVMDTDDANDMALLEAQKQIQEANRTIASIKMNNMSADTNAMTEVSQDIARKKLVLGY